MPRSVFASSFFVRSTFGAQARLGRMLGRLLGLALGGVLVALSACSAEHLAPRAVASAIARLSVRNAAMLVSKASGDTRCGFSSEKVKHSAVTTGTVGGPGSVTFQVSGCAMDLGILSQDSVNCLGEITQLGGKLIFSGTQTIVGTVTGDTETPVVPATPDAVQMHLDVVFDGFVVGSSVSENQLTWLSGGISFDAAPHLAISATTGLCSIPSSELGFDHLKYENAVVHVDAGKRSFNAHVGTSDFSAQIGRFGEHENWIRGTLDLHGKTIGVPNKSDDSLVLDADYERQRFQDSFACTPDLQVPVSYVCKPLIPALAQGVARLTAPTFGNLISLLEYDTACGFSNAAVMNGALVTGSVGRDGGSASWQVSNCVLDYVDPQLASQDCEGSMRFASGKATLTAQKTYLGYRTGDPTQPIAPTSWDPATIKLDIDFQEHQSFIPGSGNALVIHSGHLSGTILPRTARDETLGVCSVVGGNAQIKDLRWTDADVTLVTAQGSFSVQVDDSLLQAQVGKGDASENTLTGSITLGGARVSLPLPGEEATLDPGYDPATYEDSWASCLPDLTVPHQDADCALERTLGENTARLLTKTAGTMGSMVNGDAVCGFAADSTLLWPTEIVGQPGELGQMTWTVPNCLVASGPPTLQDTNCTGTETWVQGQARVWAHRSVRGERETLVTLIDSIIPRVRDASDMVLERVEFTNFEVWDSLNGELTLPAKLRIQQGSLHGIIHPITAENSATAGVYDVITPMAKFEDLGSDNLLATLEVGAARFEVAITGGSVRAMNGVWKGDGNRLEGQLTVNGVRVSIGPTLLDPGYDQPGFNASYICDPEVRAPIPHQ